MTLAAQCKCGCEAVFWLEEGQEEKPTATCDGCGAVFRINIKQIRPPKQVQE